MRYTLHNLQGQMIGTAETAQGIANIAHAGEYAHDTTLNPGTWCYYVFIESGTLRGLIGVPYRYASEAIAAAEMAMVQ